MSRKTEGLVQTDVGLIIAIVGSAVAIVGVMIALFLWSRGEANSDRRELKNDIKDLRIDLINCVRAIEAEIKDFHGRLCAIEEKRSRPQS